GAARATDAPRGLEHPRSWLTVSADSLSDIVVPPGCGETAELLRRLIVSPCCDHGGAYLGRHRERIENVDEAMDDGLRLREKMGHNAAVEIIRRTNPKTCRLVQQQRVVRHEEKRAAIVIRRIVVPPKLITLDPCDRLGAQVEHHFVMRLQRLAKPREVEHDDAICHGNRLSIQVPDPRWPLRGARHRTDAAEVRLRQVYAELGGMIGGSHKSERRMLLRKILDKVRVGARPWAA